MPIREREIELGSRGRVVLPLSDSDQAIGEDIHWPSLA